LSYHRSDTIVKDAEARIKVLRERAGEISKRKKRPTEKEEMEEAQRAARVHETSGLPVSGGHINFFGDVEQVCSIMTFFISDTDGPIGLSGCRGTVLSSGETRREGG
jgi:hypothetical protein